MNFLRRLRSIPVIQNGGDDRQKNGIAEYIPGIRIHDTKLPITGLPITGVGRGAGGE
jgi:hypothetical protein